MHRTGIWSLRFTPDDRLVCSGAIDGSVIVWDAATGEPVHALDGHRRPVLDIAFAAAGQEIVTASRDGSVAFWSRSSGERLRTIDPCAAGVFAVATTPDDLVVGGFDRAIRFLHRRRTLPGHDAPVTSLALTSDRLVSASRDGTAKVWRAADGVLLGSLNGHRHWVTKVRAAGRGAVITASEDGSIACWNLDTMRRRWSVDTDPARLPVWGLDVSADGRFAITGDAGGVPQLWSVADGRRLRRFERAPLAHRACAFSSEATLVAFGDDTGGLSVFEAATGRRCWHSPGRGSGMLSAVATEDLGTVVTGHADGSIRTLRGPTPARFGSHGRFVYQMRRSSATTFLSSAFDGTLKHWDLATGTERRRCEHGDAIFAIATWGDGRHAAAAGGRSATVWDLTTGEREATLPIEGDDVHTFVAASADGSRLVTVAPTGTLSIFSRDGRGDPRSQGTVTLGLSHDAPSAVAIDPSGNGAVVGAAGGDLWQVDLAARRVVRRLTCHEDWIRDLRITADGRFALASCQDTSFAVIDLATGTRVGGALPETHVAAISLTTRGDVVTVGIEGRVTAAPARPPPRGP